MIEIGLFVFNLVLISVCMSVSYKMGRSMGKTEERNRAWHQDFDEKWEQFKKS